MYKRMYDQPMPEKGDPPFALPGWIARAPLKSTSA